MNFFLIFFIFFTYFQAIYSLLVITIPKSGSHLLLKGVSSINNQEHAWLPFDKMWDQFMPPLEKLKIFINEHRNAQLIQSHLIYQENYEEIFLNKKTIVLFNIRDPRDQAVSCAHWQKKLPEDFPHAILMKFNDVLTDLIKSIDNYYNLWLPWMNYPYALTVRFEDLVGSKGGGDDAQQLATVKAIAKHLSVQLSEERAQEIATNLFGDNTRFTFRKGQIGAWKHEFTPEHKELFKQYGGELLIKLGYEKDLNW